MAMWQYISSSLCHMELPACSIFSCFQIVLPTLLAWPCLPLDLVLVLDSIALDWNNILSVLPLALYFISFVLAFSAHVAHSVSLPLLLLGLVIRSGSGVFFTGLTFSFFACATTFCLLFALSVYNRAGQQ